MPMINIVDFLSEETNLAEINLFIKTIATEMKHNLNRLHLIFKKEVYPEEYIIIYTKDVQRDIA